MSKPDVNSLIDLDLFSENGENHQQIQPHQQNDNGFMAKFATATMGRPMPEPHVQHNVHSQHQRQHQPESHPVVQGNSQQQSVEKFRHHPNQIEFDMADQPYIRTQQQLPSIVEHQLQYIKPFIPNLGNVPPPPPPPQQEEHNHGCGMGGCGHGNMCCRDIVSHMESCELCKRFHKKDDTVYVVIIAILIFIIVLLLNKKL